MRGWLAIIWITLAIGLGCLGQAPPRPVVLWQQTYGGADHDWFNAAVIAPDGGMVLAGSSFSPAGAGKSAPSYGMSDVWLVKISADGVKLWDRSYGGTDGDFGNRLVPTPDGGYLIGGSSLSGPNGNKTSPAYGLTDIWLVKVDADGVKQWDQTYGGTGWDDLNWLQPTPDGGWLLGGTTTSPPSGNKSAPLYDRNPWFSGGQDGWLVKVDGNGNKLWDRSYGGEASDGIMSILPFGTSEYLLVGYTSSSPSAGTAGTRVAALHGGQDGWLVRVASDGTMIGSDRTYGGSGNDGVAQAIPASDGGFLLRGGSDSAPGPGKTSASWGAGDGWLVGLDASLRQQWDQSYGGSGIDVFIAIVPTSDGGFLHFGTSFSYSDGTKTSPNRKPWQPNTHATSDIWVVRTDAAGKSLWDETYGGTGYEEVDAVLPVREGVYLLVGRSDSVPGGNRTAPSLGKTDAWVLMVSTTGVPLITGPPRGLSAAYGQTVALNVAATSPPGVPVSYQWRREGVPVADATNATLTLKVMGPAQAGNYTVVVSNQFGSTESEPARVTYSEAAVLQIRLTAGRPALTSYAPPGKALSFQFADSLRLPVTWRPLLSLTNGPGPTTVTDPAPASFPQRYYRAVEAP